MTELPMTIAELQAAAEPKMDPMHRKFVSRGFAANWTRDRNRAMLDEIAVVPRALVDVSVRDLSTTVLGEEIAFPIMCAPAGAQTASHPDGELAVARAAGPLGTLMALPVGTGYPIEDVGTAATGPLWFQHIHYSDGVTEDFLPRLKPAGFSALVLTVDAVGPFPFDEVLHEGDPDIPGLRSFGALRHRPDLLGDRNMAHWVGPNLTWDRLGWLSELSGGLPLVLKGIRNVDDAVRSLDYGVKGIVVSNHGGRNMDSAAATLDVLSSVVEAVGDKTTVILDSGIRRGNDIVKALAYGAKAVMAGRPTLWGTAVAGEAGATHALDLIRNEFLQTMGYIGCARVADIGADVLAPPPSP